MGKHEATVCWQQFYFILVPMQSCQRCVIPCNFALSLHCPTLLGCVSRTECEN